MNALQKKYQLRINTTYRYKIFLFFLMVLILFTSNKAFSSIYLTHLPDKKPKQILTDQQDQFFIDYGRTIYVIAEKPLYVIRIADPKEGYSSYDFDNAVATDGTIYSLMSASYTPEKSKITRYRLSIVECKKRSCQYQLLGKWTSAKNASYYSPGKLSTSKKGNIFFTVNFHYKRGKNQHSKPHYYFNKKKVSKKKYQKEVSLNFKNNSNEVEIVNAKKSSFFNLTNAAYQDISFQHKGKLYTYEEKRSSRYKRTIIRDKDNLPHIFFHNPKGRGFFHHFYSPKDKKVKEIIIDKAESGLESIAFTSGNDIWSVHYFYRDSFNKGLLVTQQDSREGTILDSFVLDASETRNSGWDLVGAQSSNNRILMTYLSDKNTSQREFVILKRVDQLKSILGNNFEKYGNPKGKGQLNHIAHENRAAHISRLNLSNMQSLRSGYLNVGAGIQQVSWLVKSVKPDDNSNVQTPYLPQYDLSASLLNIVSAEGKFGRVNFGLELATKYVNQKAEQSRSDAAKDFNKISGKIGWERLFFDFDFAFQYENMTSEVLFTDESGQVPSRSFSMKYDEMKFSLLALNRHHFGYVFQQYNFYQPVYVYRVLEGGKSYSFEGQAIGNIDANNHMLHYGYSTINYLVRYETQASQWFLDGEVRGGLSLADFKNDTLVIGAEKPSNELTYVFSAQLELGYVWYKRWKWLDQLGGVIKISYRLDFSGIGNPDKPEDLEEAANSESYSFNFGRRELRHGPLFFLSLNY